MKRIESGQGASDVSAGLAQEQRMGRPTAIPPTRETTVAPPGGAVIPSPDHHGDLVLRVDELENRIRALEDFRDEWSR